MTNLTAISIKWLDDFYHEFQNKIEVNTVEEGFLNKVIVRLE